MALLSLCPVRPPEEEGREGKGITKIRCDALRAYLHNENLSSLATLKGRDDIAFDIHVV